MFTDGIPKPIPLNDTGGTASWKTKLDIIKDGLTKFGNKKKKRDHFLSFGVEMGWTMLL